MVLDYGIRNPGGIQDVMDPALGTRFPLDISYFAVVLVILLNVIFGIIIDTFGDLRSQKAERLRDTTETCFICGISKQTFDRAADGPDGFKTHITLDHNMWNYMYFIMYIWQQDKDDDDGMELYVRQCIDAKDISWFPLGKAIRLNQTTSAEDDMWIDMQTTIGSTTTQLTDKLSSFKTDLKVAFGTLTQALGAEEK